MNAKWRRWICFFLFITTVIGCVGFIGLNSHVVLNRYTDSWWHIAVADEYLRTGVFAKDPFFQDAPPFAQFGLMDALNAALCTVTGAEPRRVFIGLVAANSVLFLVSAFFAGYWIGRNVCAGWISAMTWLVMFPGRSIAGIGFPFAAATPLVMLVAVSLWARKPEEFGLRAGLWRGLLLGVAFDLHVFVGLVGIAMVVAYAAVERLRHGIRCRTSGWVALVLTFIAMTCPWLAMHIALRPALRSVNAHILNAPRVSWPDVMVLIVGAVLTAVTFWTARRCMGDDRPCPEVRAGGYMLALVCGLLLLSVPGLNRLIGLLSSGYMAARIPWLFPFGIVFALAMSVVTECEWNQRMAISKIGMVLLAAVLLMPAGKTWLLTQSYLARTADYDRHAFAYLEDLDAFDLRGKVVLADPTTSYYVRGMLGAYVITSIPGVGSPAIDYGPRHDLARKALVGGPSMLVEQDVHAVLLDKRNASTRQFTGHPVAVVRDGWKAAGWRVAHETADVILLIP